MEIVYFRSQHEKMKKRCSDSELKIQSLTRENEKSVQHGRALDHQLKRAVCKSIELGRCVEEMKREKKSISSDRDRLAKERSRLEEDLEKVKLECSEMAQARDQAQDERDRLENRFEEERKDHKREKSALQGRTKKPTRRP